jgi:hypothetical protein
MAAPELVCLILVGVLAGCSVGSPKTSITDGGDAGNATCPPSGVDNPGPIAPCLDGGNVFFYTGPAVGQLPPTALASFGGPNSFVTASPSAITFNVNTDTPSSTNQNIAFLGFETAEPLACGTYVTTTAGWELGSVSVCGEPSALMPFSINAIAWDGGTLERFVATFGCDAGFQGCISYAAPIDTISCPATVLPIQVPDPGQLEPCLDGGNVMYIGAAGDGGVAFSFAPGSGTVSDQGPLGSDPSTPSKVDLVFSEGADGIVAEVVFDASQLGPLSHGLYPDAGIPLSEAQNPLCTAVLKLTLDSTEQECDNAGPTDFYVDDVQWDGGVLTRFVATFSQPLSCNDGIVFQGCVNYASP